MPLSFRLFSAFFMLASIGLSIYLLTVALTGKKVSGKELTINTLCYTLLAFIFSFGSLLFPENSLAFLIYDVVINVLVLLPFGLLLRHFWKVPLDQGMAAVFLGSFIGYTVQCVIQEATLYYSPTFGGMYLYVFITIYLPSLAMLLAAALAIPLLKKSGFHRYFSQLFRKKSWSVGTLLVSFLLANAWTLIDKLYPEAAPNGVYMVFFVTLIVVSLFWVQFMAMYAAGQEKIRAQEETITQQKAHMELLEELQQEIRTFRHDFNNLFSGITLQAQEGDLAGIQNFMRRTSIYFDEKLGKEIQKMDGLNQIGLYPVRSLLAAKLSEMQRKKIQAVLEVHEPVLEKQRMETEDLLRSLGILLDNAIEAVPKQQGKVRVVLLQEQKGLYIAVSNTYEQAPDLTALAKKGYTTKGSGHGTGLSSYRRIVNRYSGCTMRTYLKEGFFVQELYLPTL